MQINLRIILTTLSLICLPFFVAAQPFLEESSGEMGAVSSDTFINEKGDVTDNQYTVTNNIINDELIEKLYFDVSKRLVVKRYYDHFGELYYDDYGIAVYEYTFDSKGNRTSVSYFDEYKQPFQVNFVGPASIKYEYDAENHVTKVSYFDIAGDLNAGMGIAVISYQYDSNGRVVEEKRLDETEEPIDFFAPIIKYKYDNSDRVTQKSYHTASGAITSRMMDDEDEDKIAIIRFSYLGGEMKVELFDKDNRPIALK